MIDDEFKSDKQLIRDERMAIANKLLDTFKIGELVHHKWIQHEVGLAFQNIDTMEAHTKFKTTYGTEKHAIINLVREIGSRLLVSVRSKGYILVKPIDHFSISAVHAIKKVLRAHEKLEKSLDCIDYILLKADGIGYDHPQLVSDREAREWLNDWVNLLYADDVPDRVRELVEEARVEISKQRSI